MKRIDRLILGELIGPWLFGVAMFTTLLLAATYLGRIADYVVSGVPGSAVLELTILLLPAILVKTFAMAVLLASLLAFGRLSSESEIVALRAAGASLWRIIAPVAAFSLAIAAMAFVFDERFVPQAASRSAALMSEIAKTLKTSSLQPIFYPIVQDGEVRELIVAQNFNLAARTLEGVTVVVFSWADKPGGSKPSFYLWAKQMEFNDKDDWRIRGEASVVPATGGQFIKITGDVWPDYIPKMTVDPAQLFAGSNNDNDIYSMAQIRKIVADGIQNRNLTLKKVRNYEYGYWNKIALPLAAFIFGILGAILGIRNARTGTATGFAIAIAIIFFYFMLANFMSVWALGGIFPPYIASFSPIALGLVVFGFIFWRRNS